MHFEAVVDSGDEAGGAVSCALANSVWLHSGTAGTSYCTHKVARRGFGIPTGHSDSATFAPGGGLSYASLAA
jgi:hypothetical protein